MPIRAILDACVLIPAGVRDTLLRSSEAGLYEARWSQAVLEEVERNLISAIKVSPHNARSLVLEISRAFPTAPVESFERLVPTMPAHEKDRHVVAAAVASHSEIIVTYNLHHFPNQELRQLEIEAQSPDTFMSNLFDSHPDAVLRILHDQAAALRSPPKTTDDILNVLEKSRLARFVRAVRLHRSSQVTGQE